MRAMLRPRALTRRAAARLTPLLAALSACVAAPAPRTIELAPEPQPVLEGYVARARLDPGVAGTRARVEGMGARLLIPVDQLTSSSTHGLAGRLLVGGFFTALPADEQGVSARHYGAQADLRLTDHPLAGDIQPLVSLGVGAFRARSDGGQYALGSICLRPRDLAGAGAPERCVPQIAERPRIDGANLALSPAVGVRVGLLPGLAARADARDVIVYRGAARHIPELALGLSFTR